MGAVSEMKCPLLENLKKGMNKDGSWKDNG
jgi:hypothetical protein